MKILIIFVSVTLLGCSAKEQVQNKTTTNKQTKRGLMDQGVYHGGPSAVVSVYHDVHPVATNPGVTYHGTPRPYIALHPNPNKPVLEFDPKLSAQHVLYEYQETPQGAISNVHVNQQFHPIPEERPAAAVYQPTLSDTQVAYTSQNPQGHPPAHYLMQVEAANQPHHHHSGGVAAPVQHSAVINHGTGFAKTFFGAFPIQYVNTPQTTPSPNVNPNNQNVQGKYYYVNGKLVYHPPTHPHPQNAPMAPVQHPRYRLVQARPQLIHPVQNIQNRPVQLQTGFRPSPVINNTPPSPPPPSPPQLQKIASKTTPAPVNENEDEEEEYEEKSNVRQEEDDDEEERSNYEEQEQEEEDDEDDRRKPFRIPPYVRKHVPIEDEEDDEDRHHHERERFRNEDDEEEEEDRSSSHTSYYKYRPKKYAKSESRPKSKYHKSSSYGPEYQSYKNYSKRSKKFEFPKDKSQKDSKKPKMHYKAVKFYRSLNLKPKKSDTIEGDQSQNVPVVHRHKVYKENWYVTKTKSE